MESFCRYACILTVLFLHKVSSQTAPASIPPSVSIKQCGAAEPPYQNADTFTPSPAGGCAIGVPDNYTTFVLECQVTGVAEEVSIVWYRGEKKEAVEAPSTMKEPKEDGTFDFIVTVTEEMARITTVEMYSCVAMETGTSNTAEEMITIYRISVTEEVVDVTTGYKFAGHPVYLTILVLAFVLIVCLIVYGLYRCKKSNEGSYPIHEPSKLEKERDEHGKLVVEFYA